MWVKEMPYGDEFEVGVEFIDLPPEIIEYLISYIKVSLKFNEK